MDTHTAVAAHVCAQYRKDTQDEKKCLVASTASPYKFVRNVMTAIDPNMMRWKIYVKTYTCIRILWRKQVYRGST